MPIGVEDPKEYELPPHHWEALLNGIDWVVDHLSEDICTLLNDPKHDLDETWIMGDNLPELYRPLYTPVFAKQFLVCVVIVGWKLRAPGLYGLASVAEELALHAIIESATVNLDVRGIKADYDGLYDLAYEDTDFLMLFDRKFDGIEDSDVGARMGIANLRFRDWFKPFRENDPVHPYCEDRPATTDSS